MNMIARSAAAALAAALTFALTACGTNTTTTNSSATATTTASAATGSTTSTPGAMTSVSGSAMMSAAPSTADGQHNAADVVFAQQMIVHHQGAIEMATKLLTVGSDLTLNEFANAVATEQTVEIDRMREILGS